MGWFNARDYDPTQGVGQLPVGNMMPAVIISGTRQAVKDSPQDGMLVLIAQIIDGPNKGAQGAMRYNLWNSKSPQAVEIAHRQLSTLAHCVEVYDLQDDNGAELFNKPFLIDVGKQANDDRYTEVKALYNVRGEQPKRQAAPQQQVAPQPTQQPVAQPGWTPPNTATASPPAGWAPPNNAAPSPSGSPAPSWTAPAQAGPTNPPVNTGQPSWSQQPQGAPQPSWGRN